MHLPAGLPFAAGVLPVGVLVAEVLIFIFAAGTAFLALTGSEDDEAAGSDGTSTTKTSEAWSLKRNHE